MKLTHRSTALYAVLVAVVALAAGGRALGQQPAAPNLAILDVDASGVDTDCQALIAVGEVVAEVINSGTGAAAAPFDVVFFEDQDGNGRLDVGADSVFAVETAPAGLGPGATARVATTLFGEVSFRDNLIHVMVDGGGAIAELDEGDNTSNSGLGCLFVPPPGAFDPVVQWSWEGSATMPDHLNVMSTPGVLDLSGDGIPDLVFGATDSRAGDIVQGGVLRALSGDTGAELFTVTDPALAVNITTSVAVGDIDGDGLPEIVAGNAAATRLLAFENDGTFKWESPELEPVNVGAPALADLDADGTPEIVLGRQVLDADGSVRWTGSGGRGTQQLTADIDMGGLSLVADLDLDGVPEIVAGNTAYRADGAVMWQSPITDGYPAVANFDDDPFPEIVVVTQSQVYLLEHDGATKWGPVAVPGGGAGGPPTVADYEGDGEPEIGVAGAERYAVIEGDGTVKWESVTQDSSSNRTGSSVFDFDGDGSAEVVYRDELFLRIYRGADGFVLLQTPMSSCTAHEYVLVADVDADGNAEIVAVANDNCGFGLQRGVFVLRDSLDRWVSTRGIWNQHTYHVTNINDDGTIPALESNNWFTYNNYRKNEETFGSPLAAPDLTASFLRLDTAECPEAVSIVARIGSGGARVAASPVDVAFYDGDPAGGGALLGVAQTRTRLEPGLFGDVALSLSPPLEGAHEICVVADDDGSGRGVMNECDETNNQCCVEFSDFCCTPVPDPSQRTQGFWKRQCKGRHPSGEHARLGSYTPCVAATATFSGTGGAAEICRELHPRPARAKCEQAEAQFMALLLNTCSGRLAECNRVEDSTLGYTTVGETIGHIDALLSNPARSFKDCVEAQAIADAINNGHSLP